MGQVFGRGFDSRQVHEKVPYLQALFLLCAEHGTNLAGESPVTGIYRQV